ncbi:hypothetical protein E3T46_14890 [Cryobacterium sp. Hh11]|uniref:hypothetical protein n=1 Tax=Cryobacterium sp. Hh11 TaxID=2555868 RepID=UPI00106ABC74|nr:hypothetical protein [Cryobacterium sp. Hh11]TFD48713.1 hypothetical protein E3T46_14890 [Cryobacterium sp. Hh11]
MMLGHYLWTNDNPDEPGYGDQFDIDVDTLPVTDLPSNVFKSNVHIGDGTNGTVKDQLYRCWPVPNFYIDPADGRLYHSTTEPDPSSA